MPSDQRQRTLQKSRHYLVIVAETIRGKVDTAETGVGGDVKLPTVTLAPLDKINPPFPYVVLLRKLKRAERIYTTSAAGPGLCKSYGRVT